MKMNAFYRIVVGEILNVTIQLDHLNVLVIKDTPEIHYWPAQVSLIAKFKVKHKKIKKGEKNEGGRRRIDVVYVYMIKLIIILMF